MPIHFRPKEEKVKTTRTTWTITAVFRRTSRAVEYQTFRNVSTAELNELLRDPALIRVDIMGSKKEVMVETKRVPFSAAKAKVDGSSY